MRSSFLLLVIGVCSNLGHVRPHTKDILTTVYEWKQLEFQYKSENDRRTDIESKFFIEGIPAPIDVAIDYNPGSGSEVYVTIPRFQAGIPVTLGTVTTDRRNDNPLIKPFPDWSWHRNPKKCKENRLISVYRVAIDKCGRMWVLDTGKYVDTIICPPQILAFDLKTKKLIHKYEIPSNQYESRTILVTPIVDVRESCEDTFIYNADCQTYSIIVYDLKQNTSWRVSHKSMYPDPKYGTYTIAGESFDLMDGVLGMELEPYHQGKDRKLFYTSMSSVTQNYVYTSYIRNQSRFSNNPNSSPRIFYTYPEERTTQSAACAIDKDGIMYFGLHSDITLDCWNTHTPYGPRTMDVIARDKKKLQFISGVKVLNRRDGTQELAILSSRFQKIGAGTLSTREVNFRILVGNIKDLIFTSICKQRHYSGHKASSRYEVTEQSEKNIVNNMRDYLVLH